MASSASSSTPRLRVVRFVLPGVGPQSLHALLPSGGTTEEAQVKGGSAAAVTVGGRSRAASASFAGASSSSSSSIPRKRSARGSLQGSAASSSSPPLSSPSVAFHRPAQAHPEVVGVRVEDTPLHLHSSDEQRSMAAQNGAGQGSVGSLALLLPSSHLQHSSALSSAASASASANAPSLSSQLLGTMLNISQPDVAMPVDVHQFPYSGPVLSSARVKSAFPVIIPASARWFSMDSVDEQERRAFPDWLEGREGRSEATTSWYRSIRNAIITAYRTNPRVYLTITASRRTIAADAGAVARIHQFLQRCGLINYHVDPGSQPLMGATSKEKLTYPILAHSTLTHAQSTSAAASDSPLAQLYAFPSATTSSAAASAVKAAEGGSSSVALSSLSTSYPSTSLAAALPASFRRLLVGPVLSQEPNANDPRYSLPVGAPVPCKACGAATSAADGARFVARTDPSVVLCAECFANGRMPLLMVADDFTRSSTQSTMGATVGTVSAGGASSLSVASGGGGGLSSGAGEWSAEETLRLLDALAVHGEDWDTVAEQVGGKSVDECCMHFLQLPIEDPFLDQFTHVAQQTNTNQHTNGDLVGQAAPQHPHDSDGDVDMHSTQAGNAEPTLGVRQRETATSASAASPGIHAFPVPFADAGNPILAQIAFLASTVSPAVAAAAAQAALKFYTDGAVNGHHTGEEDERGASEYRMAGAQLVEVAPFGVGSVEASTSETSGMAMATVQLPWGRLHTPQANISRASQESASSTSATSASCASSASSASSAPSAPSTSSLLSGLVASRASSLVPPSSVSSVSSLCLAAAAVKARELSLDEERKMLRCVAQLLQAQLKRVEIKLSHVQELDQYLHARHHDLTTHYTHTHIQLAQLQPPSSPASPPSNQSTQPSHPSKAADALVDGAPASSSSSPHNPALPTPATAESSTQMHIGA